MLIRAGFLNSIYEVEYCRASFVKVPEVVRIFYVVVWQKAGLASSSTIEGPPYATAAGRRALLFDV